MALVELDLQALFSHGQQGFGIAFGVIDGMMIVAGLAELSFPLAI